MVSGLPDAFLSFFLAVFQRGRVGCACSDLFVVTALAFGFCVSVERLLTFTLRCVGLLTFILRCVGLTHTSLGSPFAVPTPGTLAFK